MDFGQVLHTAQQNDRNTTKHGVRYYSTKFEPPKKEKKTKPELSANIKKFLARKEAEEKKKTDEDRRRKDDLLALRSQDKKATRRVNVMLKRTKSANQSVIEDAVDNDNTAVTLAGPLQPDEDDYGYVSQEAAAYYTKMMEKYSKMPEEPPKFDMTKKKVSTNLSSTKDRVKAALEKEKEEAMMPHKRKRKHKDRKEDDDEEGISYEAPERPEKSEREQDEPIQPPPKKKPKPAPPPMNFAELLRIAEKKQHEPIIIEKKEKEEEVLMTKKQKKEHDKDREFRQRREERWRDNNRGNESRGRESENRGPPPADKLNKAPRNSRPEQNEISKSSIERVPKSNGNFAGSKGSTSSVDRKSSLTDTSQSSILHKTLTGKPNVRDDRSSTSLNSSKGEMKSQAIKSVPSSSSKFVNQNSKPSNHLKDLKQKKAQDEAKTNKVPQENVPPRKYLPGDIRGKPSEINEPSKKYLPGDTRSKNSSEVNEMPRKYLPGDIRAKNAPVENINTAKKYLPGDTRAKSSLQNEVPQRKNLPDYTKTKVSPQEDSRQRKYLPGDIRAKSTILEEPRQKKILPGDSRAIQNSKPKQFPPNDLKSKQVSLSDLRPKQFPPSDLKPKQFPPNDLKPKQFPPNDLRPKQFPPNDLRPKQFPPSDVRPKQFPPPDVRRREGPSGSKKKPIVKRRILDDDSEYDSEMDDFIDDDDAEGDYSKYISEIFGYDKSRYRDIDDDVDNMESTFAQQMREEVISTKIGIMEDLEDMKQEEQEKKRKMMMKKKRK